MQIFTFKKPFVIIMGLVLIMVLTVTTSMAQQKKMIAGKMTCANLTQNRIDVGDTEGHMVSFQEYEGVNMSTGKDNFLDGGQVSGMTFGDLIKGTGPHQGYGNTAMNGDVVFWKYAGKTVTTLSPEGKPIITFEGTITFTKGTGKYENIQGTGTYKGKYISKMIWKNEWKGEYIIKE